MDRIDFSKFPYLSTERLNLRPVEIADVHELFLIRSDEQVMKYIDRPLAKATEDAKALIQVIIDGLNANEAITWAISLKKEPKLIGTIGFWRIIEEHYRAEIGYVLHPEFQGKGIMQEALEKVLDYGFNILKLHSIEANVNPNNAASIKLLERNRFVKEAYFRENYYSNGKFLDTVIYSLINEEDDRESNKLEGMNNDF